MTLTAFLKLALYLILKMNKLKKMIYTLKKSCVEKKHHL